MVKVVAALVILVLSSHLAYAAALQDFEAGQGDWFADNGVWEVGLPTVGPSGCHQGNQCAGTILDGNYPKTDSRLVSPAVQLAQGTVQNPVLLRFWHWFAWAAAFGSDVGVVQISVYDQTLSTWSAWTDVGSVFSNSSGIWTLNVVDLTSFSGDLVRIGFYHRGTLALSASIPPPSGAGWYLDDIEVSGTPVPFGKFSVLQDFETGHGNWFADNGVWEVGLPTVGPTGCHQGNQCAGTVLDGNYPKTDSRLVSPAVQLAQGTVQNPVLLRFWHWFAWAVAFGNDLGVVQVSVYDQALSTWSAWTDVGSIFSHSSGVWTLNVVDLTSFSGDLVRIGFYHRGTLALSASIPPPSGAGWYLDDIEVGVAFTDTDNDGLPDDCETRFGLDPMSAAGDDGAAGDPDGDGVSNLDECFTGTHPRGFFTRYFAEGATGGALDFDAQIATANPGPTAARVLYRFLKTDGTTVSEFVDLPMMTRHTLDTGSLGGLTAAEFSTICESDVQVVSDRTMTWDASSYGSHAETSIAAAAPTWNLAEGSTNGFNLFYLVQNPNATAANITVTYLRPGGLAPINKNYVVGAKSRFNIWVNQQDAALASTDVSGIVASTNNVTIIVERAMYLDLPGQTFGAGHESAGVTAPSISWFFAEGATGSFFDLFILLSNPNPTTSAVRADYLLPDGTVVTKTRNVAPNSRDNIWVDLEDPLLADTAVSTTITVTNGVPIIAERSMWWIATSTPGSWFEAHNSPGSTATGTQWALAEGEIGGTRDLETFILIANTSAFTGSVAVKLLFEDGTTATQTFGLTANSRFNVAVAAEFPGAAGRRFGAVITSQATANGTAQIVVERAMYSDALGVNWAAGTNALATRLAP